MGRLGSGLTFPVSCLVLAWAAGSGSVQVLHRPTCFSDYISTSTCEWRVDGPTNCSAELRLTYQLDFLDSENHTCIPENRESTVCLCDVLMDDVVIEDTYRLGLWAGQQLLWNGSFQPSKHVKPRAPENLTVDADVSGSWWLRWGNPYPPKSYLHAELSYQVSVSDGDDPASCTVHDVTYREPTLRLPASTLKPGASYRARVRAWAQSYNSTWSEWSPGVTWLNHYTGSWERHLQLGVVTACMVILVVCVSCYFSIIKIKKEWWDQIPSPALSPPRDRWHPGASGRYLYQGRRPAGEGGEDVSPVSSSYGQETAAKVPATPPRSHWPELHHVLLLKPSPMSLWGKRPGGQEPAKRPHWKTCLTKLLPCLLEHDTERGDSPSKAARKGPPRGPGKSPWCPGAVSTRILSPESVSVVKRVELLEAQVEREEEEEMEQEKGSFCPSPESGGGSFQDSREGIAARLTESLFLDLLGAEHGGFGPHGPGESCLRAPSDGGSAPVPGAESPREEPFSPESAPLTQSPACLAIPEMPTVVADNPSYRSFSDFLSQSSGAGELASDAQLSEHLGGGDPNILSAPQPSEPPAALQPEPETWEQVLRRSVLQHRAAAAPAVAAPSGYREFACAVKQGSALGGGSSGCGPSGAAGYKAFSSLLASGATCPGTPGVEASSGEGCYRPCRSLTAAPPGVPAPAPLFTFGLDMEPPHSSQDSLLPSSCPKGPCVEPVAKGEDHQKALLSLELTTDPLGDDLGSGIVYSALTCHLCGHLKRCDSQEEHGQAQVVSSPCCGCRCGDRPKPPVSPLRGPDPLPGGLPLEGKSSLFFQPGPGKAQSPSQSPQVAAVPPAGPVCTSVS